MRRFKKKIRLMTSTSAVTGALKMETTLSSDVPGLKSR